MGKKLTTALILCFAVFCSLNAQKTERPAVWGIAKITFLVSDMDMARDYYGRFLGFDEAFSYPSPLGTVVSFKVNDRQYLEFIVDKNAKEKKRLVSVSLETESVRDMQLYLQAMNVKTTQCSIDGAGNEVVTVQDTWGNQVEFIKLKENGLHRKSKGLFLSENRISKRIHHVGLYAGMIDRLNLQPSLNLNNIQMLYSFSLCILIAYLLFPLNTSIISLNVSIFHYNSYLEIG